MNKEKQQVADELFPQQTMPYTRLKKEFLMADYDIQIIDPLHWVISKTIEDVPIVLDVNMMKDYPLNPPHMIVLSPKPFILPRGTFRTTELLGSLFTKVKKILTTYEPPEPIETPAHIQSVIDLAKATEKPISLVLGSHPGENPVGRSFYSNPKIFLLDVSSIVSGDTSRFFNIDFTNLQQMNWLCEQLPGAFSKIIMDASTMKFFTPHPDKPLEQFAFLDILKCIYRLLADKGIFFIAEPGSSYGGTVPMKRVVNRDTYELVYVRDTYPQAGTIMKEMVQFAGFQVEEKALEELTDPLVRMVHKDRTDGYGSRYFLVAKKVTEGGRRKTKRRKLNRKKTTRRR